MLLILASHFPYNSQTKHNFPSVFSAKKTMQFILICQYLIILPISPSICWEFFEPAIYGSKPANDRGIYEFELVVDYRLSMTLLMPNGTSPVLDYSPEKLQWTQRDPDRHTECGQKWALLNKFEEEAKGADVLGTLIQLNGRHTLVNAFNGQSPGPTIVVPLGAEVVLRIRNRLHSQALTIHVHGLVKQGRWWTDGVPFLQQCPIPPGSDYSYRFIADTPGTHWYHGHLMGDRGSGLVGGFIVLRPNEPTEYEIENVDKNDGEQIRLKVGRQYLAMIQDMPTADPSRLYLDRLNGRKKWIGHSLQEEEEGEGCERVERTFDGTLSRELPVSAILIGSKGWHSQSDIREHPSLLPLANFAVNSGENIVLRLVNAGISQGVFVWVEYHDFWIVAADGSLARPLKVDTLLIFSGERYDILIRGLANPKRRKYRIIFELMEQFREGYNANVEWHKRTPTVGLANLIYNENSSSNFADEHAEEDTAGVDWSHSKCSSTNKCHVFNCPFGQFPDWTNLTCLHANELEGIDQEDGEEKEMNTEHHLQKEIFVNLHDGLNGWRYQSPRGIPHFHQTELAKVANPCDERKCNRWAKEAAWNPECQCFLHYKFALGQIVQFVAVSSGGMAHPLHFHGTKFRVLRIGFAEQHMGNGTIKRLNRHLECTKANMTCWELRWKNGTFGKGKNSGIDIRKNAIKRDTIVVPAKGFVVIRFRATNPGWFFAHCHLLMHSMDGMNFAFQIGEGYEIPEPPKSFPKHCGPFEEPPFDDAVDEVPMKNDIDEKHYNSSSSVMMMNPNVLSIFMFLFMLSDLVYSPSFFFE